MAQEMIHHLDLRYKNSNMVIKLDMSKAYDRVNWNFLITVMQKMGFPPRFLTLIKHAVQNCWFSILVNGEATGFFKSTQGLRQGDPISPALLFIAAEAFSKGLNPLFNENPDMYYQTKCEVKLSHLSYADDIILFTNCKEAGLNKLMQFLRKFEDLSRQQINHAKSAFIQERKPISLLIESRISLVFSMKALPITYLGAPLYKGNKRKILYENLIDKTQASGKEFVQFEKKHKKTYSGVWELGQPLSGTIGGFQKKLQQALPTHMIELITEIPINIDQSDILHWKLSKNGALTIKSTWNEIRSHQQPQHLYRSLCV
ncbi:hypothetical protein Sango_3044900 [Sesamum angolense]|uniref:Reverse transcriptase domain-containing protein n=1 Tax=Sesamum angolense TaxID=2727404 RepID=A0AAE1W0N3_9LAMI|nr:hypothetical protein Sango_3044900 [Sesamum angolense]